MYHYQRALASLLAMFLLVAMPAAAAGEELDLAAKDELH